MTFLKRDKHCKRGKSNIIMKYWGSNGYKNKDFLLNKEMLYYAN
jgi:hypothetical protein